MDAVTVIEAARLSAAWDLVETITLVILDQPSPPYSYVEARALAKRIVRRIFMSDLPEEDPGVDQ